MAETTVADPLLIPQPHGGALMPPMRPGETRNPYGAGVHKRRLAEAIAKVLDSRGGPDVLAECLLDIALDPANRAAIPAIREVLDRLDGPVARKHKHTHELGVEKRKVRVIDVAQEPHK